MSTHESQDSPPSVVVREAAEGLQRLWIALHPPDGRLPAPHALRAQGLVALWVKGAASRWGLTRLAALGQELESALKELEASSTPDWEVVVARIKTVVTRMRDELEALRSPAPRALERQDSASNPGPELGSAYLLPDIDAETLSFFTPEVLGYLDVMESTLVTLETNPRDPKALESFFRTAHTLKGAAYMVGFNAIGDLAHALEDLMGEVRDGHRTVTGRSRVLLSRVIDTSRLLMHRDPGLLDSLRKQIPPLLAALQRTLEGEELPREEWEQLVPTRQTDGQALASPASSPHAGADHRPDRPPDARPPADLFRLVRVSLTRLEGLSSLVSELELSRGRLDQHLTALEEVSQRVRTSCTRMLDVGLAVHPFAEQPPPADDSPPRQVSRSESSELGERLSDLTTSIRQARDAMSELHGLSTRMETVIAQTWLVPFGTPFVRFRRAVSELARAMGKEVQLVTEGENLECDTTFVDKMVDPLIHLMRNAVYHGIEPPDVRMAQGKPPVGTIWLRAARHGNRVVIEVQDDGAGLDLEKIKARALALGLMDPRTSGQLSRTELINLIFRPGMSTAEAVGHTAGRGIGLDVVKQSVESLHGSVLVDTTRGQGTTFTLDMATSTDGTPADQRTGPQEAGPFVEPGTRVTP